MEEMTPAFAPLPRPDTADGSPRRVGVEIELGGLDERHVAEIAQETFGGTLSHGDGRSLKLTDSALGGLEIYLDIYLRNAEKSALRDATLSLGRDVIPIEIVTDPLDLEGLARLNSLLPRLRDGGARGSSAGLVLGFGVHFNLQVASEDMADIRGPLTAYALLEDWLRAAMPIDETRRILPFTAPYPTSFVRDLLELRADAPLSELIELYVHHNPTRNRGLDMLPLFAHLAPDHMARLKTEGTTSARPTFHFRLPDCRIDEPDWSLLTEWHRWLLVEKVAGDARLLAALGQVWQAAHGPLTLSRHTWAQRCGDILLGAGLAEEPLA
ncbi:amidoligase family protein [Marinovum sp.]|uniref:amidoligase family protein n=1 Tax=Marinovum sp. TaxID=2024839 RepID=UPI002B2693FA|nr:amidoligase family protein [Marinovum sp.]